MMEVEYHADGVCEKPRRSGMYVAWVNDEYIKNHTKRVLLMFIVEEGRWSYPSSTVNYRDHVYAWLGPLPVIKLEP